MRLFCMSLLGLFGVGLVASNSHAGLAIDSSYSEATATIVYSQGNGFSDSTSFKTSLVNNFSGSVSNTKNLSLDVGGVTGEGHYSFVVGTRATQILPQGRWNLGVSGDAFYNVSSNSATSISSNERFHSILDFTISNGTYFADFVQILKDLNSPLSSSFNSLNLNGSLSSSTLGTLYQVTASFDNTGASTYNSTFPSSFVLGPGTYSLEMDLTGSRNGLYNLSNIHNFGAISLSLVPGVAVPEPASLILWGCIAACGSVRARKLLKRRA